MVEKGADTEAVEISLNNIRESSWAAGKTFRRKHLVLLAFAEVSKVSLGFVSVYSSSLKLNQLPPPACSP